MTKQALIPSKIVIYGIGTIQKNVEILFYDTEVEGYIKTGNSCVQATNKPIYENIQEFCKFNDKRPFIVIATNNYKDDVEILESAGQVHFQDFIHIFDIPTLYNKTILNKPHALHGTTESLYDFVKNYPEMLLNTPYILTNDSEIIGNQICGKIVYKVDDKTEECKQTGLPILITQDDSYYEIADNLSNLGLAERKDFYSASFLKHKILYNPFLFIESMLAESKYDCTCNYYENIAMFSKDVIDPCCLMDKHKLGAYFVRSFLFDDVNEAFDCLPMRVYKLMILNRSFYMCNVHYCSILKAAQRQSVEIDIEQAKRHMTVRPNVILLDSDNYCNLTCPSCRDHNEMNQRIKNTAEAVAKLMSGLNLSNITEISCALYGEMLASNDNINMIKNMNLKKYPHLIFILRTNGTLIHTKQFDDLLSYVDKLDVIISIDGATKQTFEKLRRGAIFEVVLNNLKRLAELRKSERIHFLQITTVVQKDNLEEIEDIIHIAKDANADVIRLDRYQLQTQGLEEYKECDVHNISHPNHDKFIYLYQKLKDRNLEPPKIVWNPEPDIF